MDYYPYYEPSRPRPAQGIRAKSRRGRIGDTWWSLRFVEVLESFNLGARLTRGRAYARSGQVLDLAVEPGVVTASVQGSRSRPYKLSIHVTPLSETQWSRLEKAMSERALLLAKLLNGEMPPEIETVFERCRLSLFPASRRALVTECSCPDVGNPCKHIAAAYYILAEKFDDDPFLIFAWRGRSKDELMEHLRARRAVPAQRSRRRETGPPAPAAPALAENLGTFWDVGADLGGLRINASAVESPDALLDELGPVPDEAGGDGFSRLLRTAYRKMSSGAEERAWS